MDRLKDEKERLEHELLDVQSIQQQNKDIGEENIWLTEMVNDTVVMYDEKRRVYTTNLQRCVFQLLNCSVSFSNTVLQLVICKGNKLPAKSTGNSINTQRLLTQIHVAEALLSKGNLCLLINETNNFGTKVEGIHATDSDGNYWVVGIREMTTKAEKDIHQTLQTILGDIDSVNTAAENAASKSILTNIVSTIGQVLRKDLMSCQRIPEQLSYKQTWENSGIICLKMNNCQ